MLEQLRKHQGSVLHPNYSAPFHSFEDTLHRLLPYHLYQGTANSSQDYQRGNRILKIYFAPPFHSFTISLNILALFLTVDDEFERVSCQLLRRTQAMLDKYRYLLFAESKVSFRNLYYMFFLFCRLSWIDIELMEFGVWTWAETGPLGRDGDDRPDVHSGGEACVESRQDLGQGETRYPPAVCDSAGLGRCLQIIHLYSNDK